MVTQRSIVSWNMIIIKSEPSSAMERVPRLRPKTRFGYDAIRPSPSRPKSFTLPFHVSSTSHPINSIPSNTHNHLPTYLDDPIPEKVITYVNASLSSLFDSRQVRTTSQHQIHLRKRDLVNRTFLSRESRDLVSRNNDILALVSLFLGRGS